MRLALLAGTVGRRCDRDRGDGRRRRCVPSREGPRVNLVGEADGKLGQHIRTPLTKVGVDVLQQRPCDVAQRREQEPPEPHIVAQRIEAMAYESMQGRDDAT